MAERGVLEQVQACYSTWSDSYYRSYYGDDAAYPPVHRELIRGLVADADARTVLDAGCGPASLLRDLDAPGRELFGFDLTPQMVDEAGRALPSATIWSGSVTDPAAFRRSGTPEAGYDAALCCGVLPHVPEADEDAVLRSLVGAVRPGGLVVAEARNALFALFTLNRYSWELFRDQLVRPDVLRELATPDELDGLQAAIDELRASFRTDQPAAREGETASPGYDEVLSRTHHPLALADALARAGARRPRLLYYHFHPLPPMLERHAPALFRRAALAMEDPEDPRGLVMASAFLAVGTAP